MVFTKDAGSDSIEVRVQDGNVWLTQKAIATLFDIDRSVVTKHIKNIFETDELYENSVRANLHKLRMMGRLININSIHLQLLLQLDIVSIHKEQLSLDNGQQRF